MKVFWAWQSDLPGKISRHFIKKALEEAIEELNEKEDIAEPDERFQSGWMLDHDRKDVSGSPDLADEILKKIAGATLFVGDVTPVGKGAPYEADDGREVSGKQLMNPNVAIELGYALRALSTNNVLMVLNTHYGDRLGVPFDLAHKGGPILYKLAPDADKATIDTERKSLKKKLKDALELFKPKPVVKPFVERVADKAPAFFYPQNKPIGGVGNDTDRILFHVEHGPAFYLRVLPTAELQRPLGEEYLWKNVQRLGNFGRAYGGVQRTNEDGASLFEPRGNGRTGYVDSTSQAFRNGELWGINTTILNQGDRDGHKWILQAIVEQVYLESLPLYLDFIQKISGASPPFAVEAGLTGIKGWGLYVYTGYGPGKVVGTMYDDVKVRRALNSTDEETQKKFLLEFFQSIFDQVGQDRPAGLNSFP